MAQCMRQNSLPEISSHFRQAYCYQDMEKTMHKNDTILDAADIDRILTRMTHEILEVHKGVDNLTLIGIQTRGVYLAKRIQSRINKIEGI